MPEKIQRPLRIVIPGGSGQVGTILSRHFLSRGHIVTILSRRKTLLPGRIVWWDGASVGNWAGELDGADVVINLVGRSVNCRYTAANRREIVESRTQATNLVGKAIARLESPPRLWINASTATIYRHAFDRPMDEFTGEIGGSEVDAPAKWRFSIEVARLWEESFFSTHTPATRKVAVRSAMVMSPVTGGVFDMLLRLVRFGLGGSAGSGRQFVSWIHDSDFVRSIEFLIAREEMDGIVNIASPGPLPNRDFMGILRQAWGRKIGLHSAEWMLEIGAVLLGTETELVLKSRRVVPGRLSNAGFDFEFPDWARAARNLVQRWRSDERLRGRTSARQRTVA